MNSSMIRSLVTMQGLQQKMDIVANNMANLNTTGFKRREASFEDILTNIKTQPKDFLKEGRLSPSGYNQGWGSKLSETRIDFSQGTLNPTGNPTDLAIEGQGLFEVAIQSVDEQGNPVVTKAYTRDGDFELSASSADPDNVYLTARDGNLVLGTDGQPIKIPVGTKMQVMEDGKVYAYREDQPEKGSTYQGQLHIMRVVRPQYLQQVGDNLYVVPATVNNANGEVLKPANDGFALADDIKIHQGNLEQANVNVSDEMIELMTAQRAFQLNSKALTSADTMMNLANTLRG